MIPIPPSPPSSDPFSRPGPRWFSIPAHRPFLEDLAVGLHAALSPLGPEALADATVLVPTRRAARALAEAFVQTAPGRALLPPQIRALGDLDEGEPPFEPGDVALTLPAAVSPWRRRFELARLVSAHAGALDRTLDARAALELADALASFLDGLQIEEVADPDRLDGLVEGDLARHWLKSAEFLRLAVRAWPQRLAELGLTDSTQRRVALLRALADKWRANPPPGVLIAAGSTGSAPATADLLAAIAAAPQGCVVLPGLDLDLADDAWAQVGEQHPQGAMKRLLDHADIGRSHVRPWPVRGEGEAQGRWRRRLVNEALRPAEATADWRGVIDRLREEGAAEGVDPLAEGLDGLSLIAARSEDEAATVAALLLRETLETPGKTAALVTPDQAAARRVSARLARWNVAADTSAGSPLAGCPVGVLAALVAGWRADPADPVRLLGVLKHPLVRLGREAADLERARSRLERYGLRGPRTRDWAGIERRLAENVAGPEATDLLVDLKACLAAKEPPPPCGEGSSVANAARSLAQTLEALAVGPDGDLGPLWAGPAGEAAAGVFAALMAESDGLPPVTPIQFAELLETLLAAETVRATTATHPRLHILGAIEARLVRADRLVLMGLEEGVWPQGAPVDPFLSRPMRAALGLPPPERRIGLSAHDFAQAASAPEVFLLHAERRGGAPAVKSRWLWRLETLARGAGVNVPSRPQLLDWARGLDAPSVHVPPNLLPAARPEPRPPVEDRPDKLSVTRVETWVRDPYAIYAEKVLDLSALERPDEPVEARLRGTAIHAAFEAFAREWPTFDPAVAAERFSDLYLDALRTAGAPEPQLARETALAANAATWVADFERRRRANGAEVHVEQRGTMVIPRPGGDFTLTARADRLEREGGVVHVIDLKTGRAPSDKEVRTGFSPQLTLTAAILAAGGFEAVGASEPGDLLYVRLTGRGPAGEEILRGEAGGHSASRMGHAMEGLLALIARYDDPDQPYRSRTAPRFAAALGSDYDHLARVREWSVAGDDEEGAE